MSTSVLKYFPARESGSRVVSGVGGSLQQPLQSLQGVGAGVAGVAGAGFKRSSKHCKESQKRLCSSHSAPNFAELVDEQEEPILPPGSASESFVSIAKTAFALFEQNERISTVNLPEALKFIGVHHQSYQEYAKYLQEDPHRTIDLPSFLTIVKKLYAQQKESEQESEYRYIFHVLDKNGDNCITKDDLQQIITDLGEIMKQGEAEKLLQAAGDGNCIDYPCFCKLMKQFESLAQSQSRRKDVTNAMFLRKSYDELNTLVSQTKVSEENTTKLLSLIKKVKKKISRSGNNIPIHSDYWLECEGLTVYHSASMPAEANYSSSYDEDTNQIIRSSVEDLSESHSKEAVFRGRVYSVTLKPYVEDWKTQRDPEDGKIWQEKLSFKSYFQTVIWPRMSPEQQKELKEKWSVEYLPGEDLEKNYRVKKTDLKGDIIHPKTGKLLEPGLWMFVVREGPEKALSLYIARKVPGKLHHTSLSQGKSVVCAGMLVIADGSESISVNNKKEEKATPGRLIAILARSGHYKPTEEDMLAAVEAFTKIGIRLAGSLLIYNENEKSRSCRLGGLCGNALLAKLGGPGDSKVKLSTAFIQHLTRRELVQRMRSKLSSLNRWQQSPSGSSTHLTELSSLSPSSSLLHLSRHRRSQSDPGAPLIIHTDIEPSTEPPPTSYKFSKPKSFSISKT